MREGWVSDRLGKKIGRFFEWLFRGFVSDLLFFFKLLEFDWSE